MQTVDQPTIKLGAKGDAVKRARRALHRTLNPSVVVDGIFGPTTQQAVKDFQSSSPPRQWNQMPFERLVVWRRSDALLIGLLDGI